MPAAGGRPGVAPVVAAVNWVNLSTPVGLVLAGLAGARPRGPHHGIYLATGYHWPYPAAGAFVVGSVVLTPQRRSGPAASSPLGGAVFAHETRHITQYAWCLGLPFVPAYLAAAGLSWLVCGDTWTYNVFERRAGLADGGYRRSEPRRLWQSLSRRRRRG